MHMSTNVYIFDTFCIYVDGVDTCPRVAGRLIPGSGRSIAFGMTRKDYVAVASAIAVELKGGGDRQTLRSLTDALCVVFEKDNQRFSRASFEKEAGLDGGAPNTTHAPTPRRLFRGGGVPPAVGGGGVSL